MVLDGKSLLMKESVKTAGMQDVNFIVSITISGRKYLRTTADGPDPNNLLSLKVPLTLVM